MKAPHEETLVERCMYRTFYLQKKKKKSSSKMRITRADVVKKVRKTKGQKRGSAPDDCLTRRISISNKRPQGGEQPSQWSGLTHSRTTSPNSSSTSHTRPATYHDKNPPTAPRAHQNPNHNRHSPPTRQGSAPRRPNGSPGQASAAPWRDSR